MPGHAQRGSTCIARRRRLQCLWGWFSVAGALLSESTWMLLATYADLSR